MNRFILGALTLLLTACGGSSRSGGGTGPVNVRRANKTKLEAYRRQLDAIEAEIDQFLKTAETEEYQ